MNHRTLERADSLETRWKSSKMRVISVWPSSSLTRRGRTRSMTGVTTGSSDTDFATSGFARRSAANGMRPEDHRVIVAFVQCEPRNTSPGDLGLVPG